MKGKDSVGGRGGGVEGISTESRAIFSFKF